ncbi:MAG: LemA family protein [Gemmatimonadota bacterium]
MRKLRRAGQGVRTQWPAATERRARSRSIGAQTVRREAMRPGAELLRTVAGLALLLPFAGCGYNRIQALDEQVEEAKANIEAELIRRNDLIPNLVATVDEAASFEERTFTQVAEARAGLTRARDRMAEAVQGEADPQTLSAANAEVARSLRLFLNVSVEAYPTLTANQSFRSLQDELTETENRLAFARRTYNETVRTYNTFIRQFPQLITAKVIGAGRKEPFEAPEEAQEAPQVEFGERGEGGG